VLVDEYQDTNTLQAQIVDTIGSHHRIMAVGDDAQCIYSWRGANFENIMTFPERHPGTAIHRIETNYRSTPEILNLANGVLMAQPKGRHFDKELRAARGHMEKPYVVQAMDDREQAEFIVKRVRSLHEDEGVPSATSPSSTARTSSRSRPRSPWPAPGIPYHITSGVKFFERQHIRDLVALLRFVYNPADAQAWERIAVLLPKVGEKGAQKIHAAALAPRQGPAEGLRRRPRRRGRPREGRQGRQGRMGRARRLAGPGLRGDAGRARPPTPSRRRSRAGTGTT
jgi:DNA helicase II / ATP-dependent DNA helicase PcrA